MLRSPTGQAKSSNGIKDELYLTAMNLTWVLITVEPRYSGHHWYHKSVSAIERCPL